ncbi:hypothetical protein VTL71DRAFT_6668 [Oculimacula yallundae]|uniref:RRM domain-containing protein n=1 Tax=Oculimacula yallundae TaxID=86028 RepID=A0ABR4BYI9_9HELO
MEANGPLNDGTRQLVEDSLLKIKRKIPLTEESFLTILDELVLKVSDLRGVLALRALHEFVLGVSQMCPDVAGNLQQLESEQRSALDDFLATQMAEEMDLEMRGQASHEPFNHSTSIKDASHECIAGGPAYVDDPQLRSLDPSQFEDYNSRDAEINMIEEELATFIEGELDDQGARNAESFYFIQESKPDLDNDLHRTLLECCPLELSKEYPMHSRWHPTGKACHLRSICQRNMVERGCKPLPSDTYSCQYVHVKRTCYDTLVYGYCESQVKEHLAAFEHQELLPERLWIHRRQHVHRHDPEQPSVYAIASNHDCSSLCAHPSPDDDDSESLSLYHPSGGISNIALHREVRTQVMNAQQLLGDVHLRFGGVLLPGIFGHPTIPPHLGILTGLLEITKGGCYQTPSQKMLSGRQWLSKPWNREQQQPATICLQDHAGGVAFRYGMVHQKVHVLNISDVSIALARFSGTVILVQNICEYISEKELENLFSLFGPVKAIATIRHEGASVYGQLPKRAFVKMMGTVDAYLAAQYLQGYVLGNSRLRIEHKKPLRSGLPGTSGPPHYKDGFLLDQFLMKEACPAVNLSEFGNTSIHAPAPAPLNPHAASFHPMLFKPQEAMSQLTPVMGPHKTSSLVAESHPKSVSTGALESNHPSNPTLLNAGFQHVAQSVADLHENISASLSTLSSAALPRVPLSLSRRLGAELGSPGQEPSQEISDNQPSIGFPQLSS